MQGNLICQVCCGTMHNIGDTYSVCKTCGYMSSSEESGSGVEVESLEAVREKNFKLICKNIKEKFPQAKTILDVGCSMGLFLKVARDNGFSATGLEPDGRLAEEVRSCGFDVINDFYHHAEDLLNKKYDIIIFNDSLEHIPNLPEILRGIKTNLTDGGCVIINIPTSDGLVFKTASVLYKLGVRAPYHRMWQKGFASPHVHYFNLRNLKKLFENNGFTLCYSSPLPLYTVQGLWRRLSCKSSFFVSILTWCFLTLLYPLLSVRSDIVVAYFSPSRREGGINEAVT